MNNDQRRIRKIQSVYIQKQLGGYVGAISKISKISKNFPKNNWNKDDHTLRQRCINIYNIFISSKVICVLFGLMSYIFIGGLIFQNLEHGIEKDKFQKYTSFLLELKHNLTEEQYENLFTIGDLLTPEEKYLFWKDWEESVFFAFTLVSTIGYGKFTPVTSSGKIFSMFYILFGVPIGAYSFGFFASITLNTINWISIVKSDPIGRAYKLIGLDKGIDLTPNQTKRIINKLEDNLTEQEIEEVIDDADIDGDGKISYEELKKIVYIKNWNLLNITQTCQQFTYVIILIAIYLFVGTFTFSLGEQWSILDSLYFCIITITTIGLGDLYPIHNKMLVFFFSCIGLGLVALLISFLCEIINTHSNISSIQNIIRYPNSKNNLLSVNNFKDWINQENINLYHNGNLVWAICLKENFTFQVGKYRHYGKTDDWLLIWKNGKMYIMSNEDFSVVYEKVRKRDHRDSLYHLRIRFLAYNSNKQQFNIVQLRDHGKNTEIIQTKNGTYVVYDIISDSIFITKKFYFEQDYKIENRIRIDYEKLKDARLLIDEIRLEHDQINESNSINSNINELQDEIVI
jgi:hypothetical protein